jgi:hypothetical protein
MLAADAPDSAALTSVLLMIVRLEHTVLKNSGMTAGEASADEGKGSPATGPSQETR